MATPDQIQASLDATGLAAKIDEVVHATALVDNLYIRGGIGYAGRTLWVSTNSGDNAATQAASIATQLAAFR